MRNYVRLCWRVPFVRKKVIKYWKSSKNFNAKVITMDRKSPKIIKCDPILHSISKSLKKGILIIGKIITARCRVQLLLWNGCMNELSCVRLYTMSINFEHIFLKCYIINFGMLFLSRSMFFIYIFFLEMPRFAFEAFTFLDISMEISYQNIFPN